MEGQLNRRHDRRFFMNGGGQVADVRENVIKPCREIARSEGVVSREQFAMFIGSAEMTGCDDGFGHQIAGAVLARRHQHRAD